MNRANTGAIASEPNGRYFAEDREAVEQLFASCLPRLQRTARRMLHNPQDAEDAVQDALLAAFRNLRQFEGRAQFATWMHRIVRNAAWTILRKQKSRRELSWVDSGSERENAAPPEELLMDGRPNPEEEWRNEESRRAADEMVNELPPRYSEVIRLCDLEDYRGAEAAEELGRLPGTVKAQLHRARNLMRRRMQARAAEMNFRRSTCFASSPRRRRRTVVVRGSAQRAA